MSSAEPSPGVPVEPGGVSPGATPINVRALRPYGLALLAVATAVGIALAAELAGFEKLELPLLLMAIGAAVWYGGPQSGIAAIVGATLSIAYFFARPKYSLHIDRPDLGYFAIFILFALFIGSFAARRRRVEDDLRRARAELEARHVSLLDITHDTIVLRDVDGSISYWNRGAEELYGWTSKEAVNLVTHRLLQTVFPVPLEIINEELLRTSRWEGELTHTRRDGTQIVVSSRWSLQRDAAGQPLMVMETNNDITERKRGEDDIRRLNAQLEQRGRELEASNKDLEAFAYSVSHDLRAPLRHVAGYSELLQKTAFSVLDERGRRYVASLHEAAKKMGTLIDDLLAFSRIGRAETRTTLVSLGDVVREVLRETERETEGRDIQWKIGTLPSVHGDRSMLKLALSNLVANALKFTRPRPRAEIEIGSSDDANGDVVVFVRDNGVGFDMKYVNKLFGVFQRLHSVESFEGTGIGLATVQRVVARHGGRVWAESVVDGGATFYFSAPKP